MYAAANSTLGVFRPVDIKGAGSGSGACRRTSDAMLDCTLVCDFAGVPTLAIGQEVPVRLVVHLYEAGLQLILPPLLLQAVHRIKYLPQHQNSGQAQQIALGSSCDVSISVV